MTAPAPSCPFPGLLPFERSQKEVFFGRRDPTNALVARLADHAFVAVVGASGSGKSSLVRCGVLSDVRSGSIRDARLRWRVAIMQPGRAAIQALAAALAKPDVFGSQNGHDPRLRTRVFETVLRETPDGSGLVEIAKSRLASDENLLIVVDQFEELFRYGEAIGEDELEAGAFVNVLLRAREHTEQQLRTAHGSRHTRGDGTNEAHAVEPRIYVILTMRAEFLGECMLFPGLPEAINDSIFLVPHMNESEKREVIERPVVSRDVQISPECVDKILDDLAQSSLDQLPVLQHALMRTWNEWADRIRKEKTTAGSGSKPQDPAAINLCDYGAVGGIEALDRHASEAYLELDEEQRVIARRMFQSLTRVDDSGRRLRRPVQMKEICAVTGADQEAVEEVIRKFREPGREFLTLRDPEEPDAEHRLSDPNPETLIDISHESLIRKWVGEWKGLEQAGLDGEGLEKWVGDEADSADKYEQLVDAATASGGGVGFLGFGFAGRRFHNTRAWLQEQKPTASWASRYDEGEVSFAEAKKFFKKARLWWFGRWGVTVVLSAALVVFAGWQWSNAEAAKRDHQVQRAAALGDPLIGALVLSEMQDAPWITRVFRKTRPARADTIARALIAASIPPTRLREHGAPVNAMLISNLPVNALGDSAGVSVIAASQDSAVLSWTADGRSLPDSISDGSDAVTALARTPDGEVVALFGSSGLLKSLPGHRGDTGVWTGPRSDSLSSRVWRGFSRDGAVLAVIRDVSKTDANTAFPRIVLVVRTDASRVEVLALKIPANSAALSSDGSVIAFKSRQGVEVFRRGSDEAESSELQLPPIPSPTITITALAITPDGGTVATGDDNGVVRLLRLGSAEAGWQELSGHGKTIRDLAFDSDGIQLVSASEDRTARVWNVADGGEPTYTVLSGHEGPVQTVAFDPQDSLVLTTSEDGTVRLWETSEGTERATLRSNVGLDRAMFSDDGFQVLTAGGDGGLRVWSVDGTRWARTLPVGSTVLDAALDARGSRLLAASDVAAQSWNLGGGDSEPVDLLTTESGVSAVAVHPSGHRYAMAVGDSLYVRRFGSATSEYEADHGAEIFRVTYSPDGSWLATGGADGLVRIWNAAAGDSLNAIDTNSGPVYDLEFDPPGRRLLVASSGAAIWKLDSTAQDTGSSAIDQNLAGNFVASVAFGPDGNLVAIATGREAAVFETHAESVTRRSLVHLDAAGADLTVLGVAFGPDGRQLSTAASDGVIRIWDITRADSIQEQPAERLTGHVGNVNRIGYSEDGTVQFSAGEDGTVRLWPMTWRGLLKSLRASTSACLSSRERTAYLGESGSRATDRAEQCVKAQRSRATSE